MDALMNKQYCDTAKLLIHRLNPLIKPWNAGWSKL
jgi:hypothetical protein